jgi:hypothetical protein
MQQMDEHRRMAEFVDVVAGEPGQVHTVYRFPNTEHGHGRAVEYRNAYNVNLRRAMGVTDADLELEKPSHPERPDEYERAMKVESYYDESARLSYVHPPKLIANDAPLPTDYPHDHQETGDADV